MTSILRTLGLTLAAAAAIGSAHANPTVIDFEDGLDTSFAAFAPFMTNNDALVQGDYFVATSSTKGGALPDDLVGLLVDGSDPAICFNVLCPSGNASHYLASVNDGVPWMGRLDSSAFHLVGFDAGFIAAAGATIPSVPLLLRVYGFTADSQVYFEDKLLTGLAGGQLGFGSFQMSNQFLSLALVEVDFYGYACNAAGACSRTQDIAQFALDNIVVDLPEPATLALTGVAVAALAARRRRGTTAV